MLPFIPGARLELEGQCNRCGLCCVAEVDGLRLVCEHLRAEVEGGQVKPLGTPMASRCNAYEYRSQARPLEIRMLDGQGQARMVARCYKDTWQEDHTIAPHIGRGCSLTLTVHEGQLVKFQEAKR